MMARLTMNEIRRMHATFCHPAYPPATTCTRRDGAAAIRPAPAVATTSNGENETANCRCPVPVAVGKVRRSPARLPGTSLP